MNDLDRFTQLSKRLCHERDSIARCLANAYVEGWFSLADDLARGYRKARHDESFAYALLDAALSAERAARVADLAAAEPA